MSGGHVRLALCDPGTTAPRKRAERCSAGENQAGYDKKSDGGWVPGRTGDAAVAGSLVSEEVLDDDEAREDLALAVEVRGVIKVAVLRKSPP